jgi:hypothetical protein
LGSQGSANKVEFPEGHSIAKKQQLVDYGAGKQFIDPYNPQQKTIPMQLAPSQTIPYKQQSEVAKLYGKEQAERKINQPKIDAQQQTRNFKVERLNDLLSEASDDIDWSNTGFVGQFSKYIGGTSAADLDATLTTIKSNLSIDTIKQMKAMSPSGSTGFGALSEKELALVQSEIASLEQNQSPESLRKRIKTIRKHLVEWSAIQNRYQQAIYSGEDLNSIDESDRYSLIDGKDPANESSYTDNWAE